MEGERREGGRDWWTLARIEFAFSEGKEGEQKVRKFARIVGVEGDDSGLEGQGKWDVTRTTSVDGVVGDIFSLRRKVRIERVRG
jgi:hypothetical protein